MLPAHEAQVPTVHTVSLHQRRPVRWDKFRLVDHHLLLQVRHSQQLQQQQHLLLQYSLLLQ